MILFVGFTACSDDDDDYQFSMKNLIGTWVLERHTAYIKEDGEITEEWDHNPVTYIMEIIFYNDGVAELGYDGRFNDEEWSYKNGKLTLTDSEEEYVMNYTIIELNAQKMVLKEVYKGDYEYVGTSYFTKKSEEE